MTHTDDRSQSTALHSTLKLRWWSDWRLHDILLPHFLSNVSILFSLRLRTYFWGKLYHQFMWLHMKPGTYSLVWNVNIETCFFLQAPVCPQADEVAQFHPLHKYGSLLCFGLRLLWLLHSRYVFFFSTSIPIPLCSLLSLWGRGSSGLCVVTVLNIEHKRKRDTQAKASFWYSNYEQYLGWYDSNQVWFL